jgi:hypothetical protein
MDQAKYDRWRKSPTFPEPEPLPLKFQAPFSTLVDPGTILVTSGTEIEAINPWHIRIGSHHLAFGTNAKANMKVLRQQLDWCIRKMDEKSIRLRLNDVIDK